MSAKLTARERMTRLLAVIPWVVEQDGALLDDITARFDYPRKQLVDDLTQVVLFVGVHPFTPDSLIEVDITDDRVQIRYADWFSQPLRLTPEEGARLLTAGRTVLSMTADEGSSPLLRALAKLGMALGEGADSAVDVRLGNAPEATLGTLRQAVGRGTQVELDYYTYGRDELTTRRVDPARVFSDHGNWYLHGYCHRADDERVFRVDRIRDARPTDDAIVHPLEGGGASFTPGGDDPRVRLVLRPSATWVVEQYPTDMVTTLDDGRLDVVMAVTAVPWLERLLLRLGDDAEILDVDPPLEIGLAAAAAARILTRYRP
ncbi:MAG: WYL domain-containing protein [Acidimicrobiales bacterium]